MLTSTKENKSLKIESPKEVRTLQLLLDEKEVKKFSKDDLLNCEASIFFLERIVFDIESFVENRKKIPRAHLEEVERKIDELSAFYLEHFKKELNTAIATWGRRPYEDFLHEKGIYE